jgi:hypothetical protein
LTAKFVEKFRVEDYTGLYDADINLLDIRIKQLERENLKRKEIVSLREQNRLMKEKLAERERENRKSSPISEFSEQANISATDSLVDRNQTVGRESGQVENCSSELSCLF